MMSDQPPPADVTPQRRDRLPSIKQILAILFAGVLLFPGMCVAIGFGAGDSGATIMILLAAASVLFTVAGALLLLIRGIRDFIRH
jgi:hypothetical protein